VRIPAAALLIAALCAGVPATAEAKSKHGVTALAPKAGAVVKVGQPPRFKARVRGPGTVYFHVCKSKRRNKDGKLCNNADIDRGKKGRRTRRGRMYTFKPEDFTFPTYWVNTPRVYYWQAYRINCTRDFDCIQEGPVIKFRVR